MENITKEKVKIAKEYLDKKDYQNFFELFFAKVYWDDDAEEGDDIELEVWTDGDVDMITQLTLNDEILNEFCERAHDFDVDEEIRLMREDPFSSYCQKFTCRESVEDYEDYKSWLEEIASIIEGTWKEKTEECPDEEIIAKIYDILNDSLCPDEKSKAIEFIVNNW